MNYVHIIESPPLLEHPIMEPFLATCAAIALSTGTPAPNDYSAMIAQNGLRATEAALVARANLTPDDLFALGGLRFLGAIETALQTRYRSGMAGGLAEMTNIPILRLPIPENPAPEPFDPAIIATLFTAVTQDMDAARAALNQIGDDEAVGVVINTDDLWFDINMNGTRDDCEGVLDITGQGLDPFGPPLNGITVRFDTADAAWLSAYAHLLSGLSETVLAFDPTEAITATLASVAAMEAFGRPAPDPWGMGDFGQYADMAAIIIGALEVQPDPARTGAAHAHLKDMIAGNRTFWSRVALETDNEAEWIPNKNQQSALPIAFPPDTGARWQAVLADAEALLNGNLLIPHWRIGENAGINLARLFQDPPEVDIVGMIQGETLVPYMEQGRRIDSNSLMLFDQLMQGNAGLYMVILN